MRRIGLILGAIVLLGGWTLSGCVIDDGNSTDSQITCDNLDMFLADCGAGCGASWGCEDNYDSLDLDTQLDLDDCSDCLADSAADGTCADCAVPSRGIDSCLDFMDTFLGVDCW